MALTGEPVLAALLAWRFLVERPTAGTTAGGLLVLVGIFLAARATRR